MHAQSYLSVPGKHGSIFKLPRNCLGSEMLRFRCKWSNLKSEELKEEEVLFFL